LLKEEDLVKYRKLMVAVANKVVNNPDDAEDIAQEAALRAWKFRHTYTTDDNVMGWLATIARRLALSFVLKKKNLREDPIDGIRNREPSHITKYEEIEVYLEGLTELEKDIILMVDYMGHEYDTVCKKYNFPIGTVKSKLFRARRKARKLIISKKLLT
jgi:RNA polymerase sigma factor (sigma-70 family)